MFAVEIAGGIQSLCVQGEILCTITRTALWSRGWHIYGAYRLAKLVAVFFLSTVPGRHMKFILFFFI